MQSTTTELNELTVSIIDWFTRSGETLATAESLTGGLLSTVLTEIPGASSCIRGGVTTYATYAKAQVLGVDAQLLEKHGAVHPEVAQQMSTNVRELFAADWGIATTGVAGPATQDGQPVGTVFIAVANENTVTVEKLLLKGTRSQIRTETVVSVLKLLLKEATDDILTVNP